MCFLCPHAKEEVLLNEIELELKADGIISSLASHTYFGGSGRNTYGDYGQLFGNNAKDF